MKLLPLRDIFLNILLNRKLFFNLTIMTPYSLVRTALFSLASLIYIIPAGAQCTVSGSGNVNFSAIICLETGSAPVAGDEIIIPNGVTLLSESNNQNFGAHDIRIESGGTLQVDHNSVQMDGNIFIESGGTLQINGKIEMTCGSAISNEGGGTIITGSSSGASDKLSICGNTILQGGGGCTEADGGPDSSPPYCAGSGITIETSFDETGEAPGVLPIVLLSFTAEKQAAGVRLHWSTAIEERNAYFELENSRDGQAYQPVAQLEGAGNSTSIKRYSYLHEAPLAGVSYYRLVQVDTDDTRTVYGPVRVDMTTIGEMAIYPNPVVSGQEITVQRNGFGEGELAISMMDLQGRVLQRWKMDDTSSMKLAIPASMDRGIYLLEISGGGKKKLHRLVLQ